MLRVLIAGIVVVCAFVGQAEAQSRTAYCARWHNVCRTTCPANTPKVVCHATCDDRLNACKSSGCYFFNVPGPRCEGQVR
jgi:hypothetical protein